MFEALEFCYRAPDRITGHRKLAFARNRRCSAPQRCHRAAKRVAASGTELAGPGAEKRSGRSDRWVQPPKNLPSRALPVAGDVVVRDDVHKNKCSLVEAEDDAVTAV